MADLLRLGSSWLAAQLKTFASRTVIYQRGTQQVTVQATLGKTLLKLNDGFGQVRMEWTDRDFLIATADLVFAGITILPERGDRILVEQDAKLSTYEVMAPLGEAPWRYSDPHQQLLRIHTKHLKTTEQI